ncbi:hypothetical protein [Microbacterium mcarthurae (nom. nud.)]|uniref:Excalibur calcium-binding domain-containing protein n=1 Tax=Microbacterium mcarthurae TaxID=3035918 RepID=A0ABW9GHN1_9MICO
MALAAASATLVTLLVATPATAADANVTADVSTSCEGGTGTVSVSVQNDVDAVRRIDIAIDRGNDGEADFGDGPEFRPGENINFDYSGQPDGRYGVSVRAGDVVVLQRAVDIRCATPTAKYFVTAYDGTVWRVTDTEIRALGYEEWKSAGFPSPAPAPTDYVKYPWSTTVSAVTFFGQSRERWVWRHVSFAEWTRAGQPYPRNAGWIEGSTYYQWATSSQIFVQDVGGVRHALTYAEWRDSGFEPFQRRSNEGFVKLSWDDSIAFLTDVQRGQGGPIGFDRWRSEGYPQPSVAARFPGDQVWRTYGSPDIWYEGPTTFRRINGAEWAAMGRPAPTVRNIPPRPADKNCSSYGSQAQAQADFAYYYEAYGDVFGLDADRDGVACENHRY